MSSTLRPDLGHCSRPIPVMTNGTAYLMIYTAVSAQQGLCHGRLHAHGQHCAIGSYFDINDNASLTWGMVDEVAAVNDSVPHMTARQRKIHVSRWLRWKLALLGMPGFQKPKGMK